MPPSPNKNTIGVTDPPQIGSSQSAIQDTHHLRLLFLGIMIFVLAVLGLVLLNRQSLQDWWRLRGYQPPASVVQLADQDGMNAYTRHLFYLNKPQLLGTVASFRQYCPENKETIVLGCYHPDQNGIFIYRVSDQALAGVQQVTAAHEVLHAIYARLSTSDRAQLNGQLEDFYKHGLNDPRVLAEVRLYQQTEPNDVLDEMSCTFGTEVAKLPASLEAYYARFFTQRAAIVAYEERYEGAFTQRQTAIKNDDRQLAAQKQQIDDQQAALNAQLNQINSDRSRLDSLLAAGKTAAYNAAVPEFNNEIDVYNAGLDSLRNTVAAYNQLVTTRNQIAGQLATLASAIDTRQIPQAAK